MALVWQDGFEHYANADLAKKWTGMTAGTLGTEVQVNSFSAAAGAWPGEFATNCMQSNATNNRGAYKTLPSTYATGVVGIWFWTNNCLPDTNMRVLVLGDGTTEQISVRGDGIGHLTVTRGGTVLGTSTRVMQSSTWYFLELKATINNTTGVIELRVNGDTWIASTSSLNTRSTANNYFNTVHLGSTATSYIAYKSIYVLDTTGTVGNDFIGPCIIKTLRPRSAGNYSQWTAAAGKNFGMLQEQYADGDVSTNATTTAANIDTFGMTELPAGTVYGVQYVNEMKQDAGAARTMAPLARISSTDYAGTTVGLTASYVFYTEVKPLSPATSAQWTTSEINGAEFGYKLVS